MEIVESGVSKISQSQFRLNNEAGRLWDGSRPICINIRTRQLFAHKAQVLLAQGDNPLSKIEENIFSEGESKSQEGSRDIRGADCQAASTFSRTGLTG